MIKTISKYKAYWELSEMCTWPYKKAGLLSRSS